MDDILTQIAAVDAAEARIVEIAARHGLAITRSERSGKSCSRYVSIGDGFDQPKSLRRRYCAETGLSYPRHSPLNVRISNHSGMGDGTTVHLSIRLDHDAEAGLARLDNALALLVERAP